MRKSARNSVSTGKQSRQPATRKGPAFGGERRKSRVEKPSRLTQRGTTEKTASKSGPEKAALAGTKSFIAETPPPKSDHDRGRGGFWRQKTFDMGSRKKKKIDPKLTIAQLLIKAQKKDFLAFYRPLNIHEKISIKVFVYAWGRGRYTLQDLLKPNKFWAWGPLAKKNMINDGYSWYHHH